MSRITVRAAHPEDAEKAGRLMRLVTPGNEVQGVLSDRWVRQGGTGWVAEQGKLLAGFCLLMVAHHARTRHLQIGVRPSLTRMGIGSALMRRAKDHLVRRQGIDHVDAVVDETDLPTQLFLKRHGFYCRSLDEIGLHFRLSKAPVDDPRRLFVSSRVRGSSQRER